MRFGGSAMVFAKTSGRYVVAIQRAAEPSLLADLRDQAQSQPETKAASKFKPDR